MKTAKGLILVVAVTIIGPGWARAGGPARVYPTGTPQAAAAPAPTPVPLTPVQRAARTLGGNLATVDLAVWKNVRENWHNSDACLQSVDAQLEAATPKVFAWLKDTDVINCTLEEGTGRRSVRLTSDEARASFVKAYRPAMDALRALKEDFRQDPEALKFLAKVRRLQDLWQGELCKRLEKVRPPIVVPKPVPFNPTPDPAKNS